MERTECVCQKTVVTPVCAKFLAWDYRVYIAAQTEVPWISLAAVHLCSDRGVFGSTECIHRVVPVPDAWVCHSSVPRD